MSQQIHHVKVESFLTSAGSGKINLEQSIARLRALCEVWNQNVSQNVLFDVRKRAFDLSPADIKSLMEVIGRTGLGQVNKVALIYVHRETFDPPVFLAFLAEKMALNIKAFDDYEDAVAWLASSKSKVAEFEND